MDREALLRMLPEGQAFADRPIALQKHDIEIAIERFLAAVTAEHREPDLWERFCISEALAFVREGYYGSALANVAKALEAPEERSPDRIKAAPERLSALDRRALHARLEQVRQLSPQARGINRSGGAPAAGPAQTALHYGALN